jgi:hypothetical protein
MRYLAVKGRASGSSKASRRDAERDGEPIDELTKLLRVFVDGDTNSPSDVVRERVGIVSKGSNMAASNATYIAVLGWCRLVASARGCVGYHVACWHVPSSGQRLA